jgi:hypothetical protein
MPIPAINIIRRVSDVLQDDATRWTAPELIRWLNDGQREVQIYRPDATSIVVNGTLPAGARQSLKAIPELADKNPLLLMNILRNTSNTSGLGSVVLADRAELDAIDPGWYSSSQSTDIEHYMVDQRDPLAFLVYPPALSGAQLELLVSVAPVDVPAPTGDGYDSITGSVDMLPYFSNALVDYVLHRAYLKDAEFSGDASRAIAHYNAFGNALGLELKSAMMAAPGGTLDNNKP